MAEPPSGPWVDNHCHLGTGFRDEPVPEVAEAMAEARDAGVVAVVDVGTDAESSSRALERARRHAGVWATAGLHPHDAVQGTDGVRRLLQEQAGAPELVAVGECGLDHHYDNSPRDVQLRAFVEQIEMAHESGLPLVIHTRDAWDETFQVLDDLSPPPRTVLHCFTGGPDEAERALERGLRISVSGILTFPSADDLRRAVALCPLDALMVETDAPFLAPVPHRGRANRPALVPAVGAAVAEVLGLGVAEVARATTDNAAAFYGLETLAGGGAA